MEEFDKGVRIGSSLYEIFCRAYNIDQQFTRTNLPIIGDDLTLKENPVEEMDRVYRKNQDCDKVEIEKTKIVYNNDLEVDESMQDADSININLLNPFQCCLITEPLLQHQIKPCPDRVTIASIIYLIRLDNITRDILKILDVKRENVIIKSLYTLANKLDHEPGKTKISFQDMVGILIKFLDNTIEASPEESVDSGPWVKAVEHNLLGI